MRTLVLLSVLCLVTMVALTSADGSCKYLYNELVEARKTLYVEDLPECEEDGSFSAKQCNDANSSCWCSSPDGLLLQGTMTENGASLQC
ncbi:SPARC-related modular calcium-binding protein 1-like [Clavelina lepadiformis]